MALMDEVLPRSKTLSEREQVQELLKDRPVGARGFFASKRGEELPSWSVQVAQDGSGQKIVMIDSPHNHETDGQLLNSEQVRQIDWNNDHP